MLDGELVERVGPSVCHARLALAANDIAHARCRSRVATASPVSERRSEAYWRMRPSAACG
jgi:hypothetical protein